MKQMKVIRDMRVCGADEAMLRQKKDKEEKIYYWILIKSVLDVFMMKSDPYFFF